MANVTGVKAQGCMMRHCSQVTLSVDVLHYQQNLCLKKVAYFSLIFTTIFIIYQKLKLARKWRTPAGGR